MNANVFIENLKKIGIEFFTGVPDSLLAPFVDLLMESCELNKDHIVGANEGACIGMAAGYHLATGKVPCVYMQNSGIGNAVNPIASLMNEQVYGIPALLIVGHRGQPGVHDEPQHVFQGEITVEQLELLRIHVAILKKETTESELMASLEQFVEYFKNGKMCALVIEKGALESANKVKYQSDFELVREHVIEQIVLHSSEQDCFISSTGKISRELFEIREKYEMSHRQDFLTVGSMGHAVSIALGVAMAKHENKVICIDGDGAMIMHLGALTSVASISPRNFVHIVLDNNAHETVGGIPTAAKKVNLAEIARSVGYSRVYQVTTQAELARDLSDILKGDVLTFAQIKVNLLSRSDLGRPTTTARENKNSFMNFLKEQ